MIVVVSDKYTSNHLHITSPLEVVGVEVYCPNKVVILCLYVPPGLNKFSVSKEIERIVQDICNKTDQIIAVGDFNEDLFKVEGNKSILDTFQKLGFTQSVQHPTTDYASLLDHVYSRSIEDIATDVQDAYYSDHDKVFCFFK